MRNKEFEPELIADAAMQVFWEKGYAATSVQDLVESTGLSRSSLYNTFENKQNLYQEALRRYHAFTSTNIDKLVGTGSVKNRIKDYLMMIVKNELEDPQQRGCFIANATLELAAHDENVAKQVQQNLMRLSRAFENLILQGQQTGEISSNKNAKSLSYFFVNTIQGMRVLAKGCPDTQRQECLEDIINIALLNL